MRGTETTQKDKFLGKEKKRNILLQGLGRDSVCWLGGMQLGQSDHFTGMGGEGDM